MKHLRKNDGFTLVELMVTLVVGSLIMAAAVTILLLSLRINKQGTETVSQQNTTRILLTALEDLATEDGIKNIVLGSSSWTVYGEGETPDSSDDVALFSYSSDTQTVYVGEIPKIVDGITIGGPALMEGVISSYVELNDNLLTFSVETEDGIYNSSVYCRQAVSASGSTDSGNGNDDGGSKGDEIIGGIKDESYDTSTARSVFLKKLASQYGSTGNILVDGQPSLNYYTKWYCGGEFWEGWNAKTPWCACFVSWALAQSEVSTHLNSIPKFANVDNFLADFVKADRFKRAEAYNGEYTPLPGDLIFFDWIINSEANTQHVGVVLAIVDNYVYTIEGNTADMVAVRKYALDDPRILGYGVLDWNETT